MHFILATANSGGNSMSARPVGRLAAMMQAHAVFRRPSLEELPAGCHDLY
jgi:hypothetical protein